MAHFSNHNNLPLVADCEWCGEQCKITGVFCYLHLYIICNYTMRIHHITRTHALALYLTKMYSSRIRSTRRLLHAHTFIYIHQNCMCIIKLNTLYQFNCMYWYYTYEFLRYCIRISVYVLHICIVYLYFICSCET